MKRSEVGFAVALLALGALRHYGYKLAPLAVQADVQNACTALVIIAGVVYASWHMHGWLVIGIVGWWAAEELLVVLASLHYILAGSPATEAGDQMTGLIGFDLGRIGILALAILAHATVKSYRCQK